MSNTNKNKFDKAREQAETNLFIFSICFFIYIACLFQPQNNSAFEFVLVYYIWVIFWVIMFKRKRDKEKKLKNCNNCVY